MIFKISVAHLFDHFWFGIGIGKFSLYYPQWQIAYFHAHGNPPPLFLESADDSYFAFNEFLQLFIETGFIGFCLFSLLLYKFFTLSSITRDSYMKMLKYTVVVILACGLTSYPFHTIPVLFIMIFCIVSGFKIVVNENILAISGFPSDFKKMYINKLIYLFVTIGFVISVFLSVVFIKKCNAICAWSNLSNRSIDRNTMNYNFSTLNLKLQDDGNFLESYGQFLLEDSTQAKKAYDVLTKSLQFHFNYDSYELIAQACLAEKDTVKAISYYQKLSDYIPTKLLPRYKIVKLLQATGKSREAKISAANLLQIPVKVPSEKAIQIRNEMQSLLGNNK
jgi:hypothetical protein